MSRYQGMVLSGRAYSHNSGILTGFNTATAVGTTPPYAVYNPIGSGINVVIWKVSFGLPLDATASARAYAVCLAANTSTTASAPTGTAGTPTHNFFGNVMGFAAKAQPIPSPTLTATPTLLRPLWNVNA